MAVNLINEVVFCKGDLPKEFLDDMRKYDAKSISYDGEMNGLDASRDMLCLSQVMMEIPGCDYPKVYLVQYDVRNGEACYDAPVLRQVMEHECPKLMHFARADMNFFYSKTGIMARNVFCTRMASYVSRTYTESHGLKALCLELLGIELSKEETSTDWTSKLSDKQIMYAARDVIYLPRLRDALMQIARRIGRVHLIEAIMPTLGVRVMMDNAGFVGDYYVHNYSTQKK